MTSAHTPSIHLLVAVMVWLPVGRAAGGEGPSGQVAPNVLLQQAPQSQEDVQKRKALAEPRLSELTEAIDKARASDSPAPEGLRTAYEDLAQAWKSYLKGLDRVSSVGDGLRKVTSPEHLESLTKERARMAEETRELKRAPIQAEPTEEQVEQLRASVAALEARVSSLAESQAGLSKQLSGGFQQQTQAIQKDLQQLRQRRDEVVKNLAESTAAAMPADHQRLELEKEGIDVRMATAELALQNLGPEEQYTRHAFDQSERTLGILREQLSTMQERLRALTEARTRARVKELEAAEMQSPADTALRDLQLFRERVLLHYFREPKRTRRTDGRLSQQAADRLRTKLDLARAFWTRAQESVSYRSGDKLARLLLQSRNEIEELVTLQTTFQKGFAQILNESQEIQIVRERVIQRFTVLGDRVNAATGAKDIAGRAQLEAAVAKERAALEEGMRANIKELEESATRIEDAIALTADWLSELEAIHRSLRWERRSRPDSGLRGAEWAAALAELTALVQAPPQVQVEGDEAAAAATLHRELFGEQRSTFTDSRRVLHAFTQSVSRIPAPKWFWTTLGVLLAGCLGVVIYVVARRRGVRLAREIVEQTAVDRGSPHPVSSGLSRRINLMFLNMTGDLAIPLLVAGAIVLAVWQLVDDVKSVQLVAVIFGAIALAITLLRLVHHLFEAESPPHRPIPCDDRVARHYRKWLGVLIVFSLFVLLAPLVLMTAGVAPAFQTVLMEIHKTGFLVLLLLFLVRKECVLGLGNVGELSWGLMLTWITYPILLLAVAALLILQVIGYGVLVTYLGIGLLSTVGILIVMGAGIEYLNDLIDRRVEETSVSGVADPAARTSEGRHTELEAGRTRYLVSLLRWFVRIAGVLVTILLILRAWGLPMQVAMVDWRGVGLGFLVVLLALLLDRLLLTTLLTLKASGRLPESTLNILRRWFRGALSVVVALAFVAIAGFDVKSIWTLLATLLAMIAVGFVAVWSILSNILATLVILIWRPFNVGEHVTLLPEGLEGQVVDINFMYTTLKSDGGSKIAIPNNFFAQKFIRREAMRGQPKRTLAEQLEAERPLDE